MANDTKDPALNVGDDGAVNEAVDWMETQLDDLLGADSTLTHHEQRRVLMQIRDRVLERLDDVTDTLLSPLDGLDETESDEDDEDEGD